MKVPEGTGAAGTTGGGGLGQMQTHASQMPRGQGRKSGLEIILPLSWLTHGGAVPI